MKHSRLLNAVISIFICAFMLFGCSQAPKNAAGTAGNKDASGNSSTPAATGEPIKIGVLIEQSGSGETWGTEEQRGLELGFLYATNGTMAIGDRPIKLIIEDTTSQVNVGVQKATKLLESDKVDILTGTTNSSIALAAMELAKQYQTPYIVTCAAANSITGANFNEYTFQTGRTVRQVSLCVSEYLPKIGKDFALLFPDYAGGIEFAEAWEADTIATGGNIVYKEYPATDTSDFTPYLKAVKDAKPDALIVGSIGNSFTVKLPQQIQEMNILKDMKYVTDFADREFFRGIGNAGVGMIGSTMYYWSLFDTPANKWLVDEHEKAYGEKPDLWSGNSFSGAIAIVEGIKKADSLDSRDLINAFEGLTFNGVKGEMTIRAQDHLTIQPMPVVELRDLGGEFPEPVLLEMISAEKCTPEMRAPGR